MVKLKKKILAIYKLEFGVYYVCKAFLKNTKYKKVII